MCGIVGYISKEKNKEKVIKKMADRIIHRGPDAEGYYVDQNIALGHRRLSIIDLKTGDQPIFNEDKSLVVIFNGEIYNYVELKKELIKKKHQFKTTSDTEVLLHGYEEYQEQLPKKLRGMFSFAIWDIKKQELFCARDHFGIKPYYYYWDNKTFMFASEIKSFLDNPLFKKEYNSKLLQPYLAFNFTPTEETFFKNVYRLNPGHYLIFKENKLTVKKYFDLTFKEETKDYQKTVDEIAKVMTDSVEKHMLSDVEVGSFLSSGVDSSYIVSLAKPDKTYTVGYDIEKYNEISYAEDLAQRLNINNTSKKITKEEYMKAVPDIMYHMDEPLADPAAIALYFVSQMASKDLKVVLSGEGADEFFGGYNYYREEVDYQFYNKIPYFIRHLIALGCSHLPEIRGLNFLVRRGQKLEDNYIGVNKVFSEKEAKQIVAKPIDIRNKNITKEVYDQHAKDSNIIKMQAIDINYWLMKDILHKADRMTMAFSLEGRVPFVDIEVFKVASKLPFNLKVTKENTKVALRDASKKVIPNESYKKKKLGFPVPLRNWMRDDDVYENIKKTFKSKNAQQFFKQDKIIKLLNDHRQQKKDNYKKVWTIYSFLIWYDKFFGIES